MEHSPEAIHAANAAFLPEANSPEEAALLLKRMFQSL
jgi:hypothetical protein